MYTKHLENLRILVIEDDYSLRTMLRKHLGVTHDVTELGSKGEVLQLLTKPTDRSFDVILLDKGLPDGNGLELISSLLEHSPRSAIIVFTGDGNYRSVQDALRLGAHDFLVKSESLIEELTLRLPIAIAHANVKQINRGDMVES
jgi:DNA-binding NtrC family response regulator